MVYAFALLAVAVSLELLVRYQWSRTARQMLVWLSISLFVVSSAVLLTMCFGVGSLAVSVVSAYSIFNMVRTVTGRYGQKFLNVSAGRTAMWLGGAHVACVYYMISTYIWRPSLVAYVGVLVALQLGLAVVVWLNVRRQLRTTQLPQDVEDIADSQLPTVTVAVPVRNEAGLLEACLEAALSSNYPKLEILAFDDGSHDRTPDIIRSFAHAGVRFIRSAQPANGWLPKNQAYNELAQAANGEYILFVGADVRLGVRSIRQLVSLAEGRNKHMVSVLPLNRGATTVPALQAMRYFWEMGPPRRLFNRPPVLSSCWLIKRKVLRRYGSFAAFKQSISCEAHLAQAAMHDADGYSFVRGDEQLALTSQKPLDEQRATARLRRYPQAHRRPELVLAYSIGQLGLLLGPAIVALVGVFVGLGWLIVGVALVALIVHVAAFGMVQRPIFSDAPAWRAYAAYFPAIASDIWYLNQSMVLYEFRTVSWKERNVVPTVMHK